MNIRRYSCKAYDILFDFDCYRYVSTDLRKPVNMIS